MAKRSKSSRLKRKTRGKKRQLFQRKNWWMILVFLLGFVIAVYPLVSQFYYQIESNNEIRTYQSDVSKLDAAAIQERIHLAQAFNSTLKPGDIQLKDPFSDEEREAGLTQYGKMLAVNERLGFVEIPRIKQQIPMYVGSVEDVLQKGAGLLEGTSLPVGGDSTHTVITAHRGLPTARLFTDLNKMKKGDVFYIHVLDQVLAYKVDQILTVEPTNFEPVMIQEGKDYATLLTCTPYMINSHRLLVRGERIDYTAPVDEVDIKVTEVRQRYLTRLAIALVIIVILTYLAVRYRLQILKLVKGMEKLREK